MSSLRQFLSAAFICRRAFTRNLHSLARRLQNDIIVKSSLILCKHFNFGRRMLSVKCMRLHSHCCLHGYFGWIWLNPIHIIYDETICYITHRCNSSMMWPQFSLHLVRLLNLDGSVVWVVASRLTDHNAAGLFMCVPWSGWCLEQIQAWHLI